jgi:hypothetical protein
LPLIFVADMSKLAVASLLIEPEDYESDQLEKFKEYGYKPKQKAILGQAQQE